MFEQWKENEQFRSTPREQRGELFFQPFVETKLKPAIQDRTPEQQEQVLKFAQERFQNFNDELDRKSFGGAVREFFDRLRQPISGEQFVSETWQNTKALAAAPLKLGLDVMKAPYALMNLVTPEDSPAGKLIQQERAKLDRMAQALPKAQNEAWDEVYYQSVLALVGGAGIGAGIFKFKTAMAPWLRNMTQQLTTGYAAKTTAFSTGVGSAVLDSAVAEVVDPWLETQPWEAGTKMTIKMGIYLGAGLIQAATLDNAIDAFTKNPAFTEGWQKQFGLSLAQRANARSDANLFTEQDRIMREFVNDPEARAEYVKVMKFNDEQLAAFDEQATVLGGWFKQKAAERAGDHEKLYPNLGSRDAVQAWFDSEDFAMKLRQFEEGQATDNWFGGQRTASPSRLQSLAKAEEQMARGADPDQVWRDTGWWEIRPGEWRYELPREGLEPIMPGLKKLVDDPDAVLLAPEVIKHPTLFEEFPFLRYVKVEQDPSLPMGDGSYFSNTNTIKINIPVRQKDGQRTLRQGEFFNLIGHELQHAIQKKARHAQGGNAETAGMSKADRLRMESFNKRIQKIEEEWPDADFQGYAMGLHDLDNVPRKVVAEWNELNEKIFQTQSDSALGQRGYMTLTGEAEARLTAARAALKPENRMATSPRQTMQSMLEAEGMVQPGDPYHKWLTSRTHDGKEWSKGQDMIPGKLVAPKRVWSNAETGKLYAKFDEVPAAEILNIIKAKNEGNPFLWQPNGRMWMAKNTPEARARLQAVEDLVKGKTKPATSKPSAPKTVDAEARSIVRGSPEMPGTKRLDEGPPPDDGYTEALAAQGQRPTPAAKPAKKKLSAKPEKKPKEKLSLFERQKQKWGKTKPKPVEHPVRADDLFESTLDEVGNPLVRALDGSIGRSSKFIRASVVAEKYPNARAWMVSSKDASRSIEEGWTNRDIVENLRAAYNHFRPGSRITDSEITAHMHVLRELEDMMDSVRIQFAPKEIQPGEVPRWQADLMTLRQMGVMDDQEFKVAHKIMERLARNPDFSLTYAKDGQGAYAFFQNIIKIANPSELFHEVGHWAWYHVLTKQDRLGFAQEIMTNYRTIKSWDNLWPMRPAMRNEQGQMSEAMDWITELYADLSRQYITTYHLTSMESASILKKMLNFAKKVFRTLREEGYELPKNLRPYIDKIMKAPNPDPRKKSLVREYDDLIERWNMYLSRNDLVRAADAAVQAGEFNFGPEVSAFVETLIKNDQTALDAIVKSGANLDNVLQRLYHDLHAWWHFDSGNPQHLDVVFGRMKELFMPENQDEVFRRLEVSRGRPTSAKHDPKYDPKHGDYQTPEEASQAARAFGKQSKLTQDLTQTGLQLEYRALRQMFNDMAVAFELMKIRRQLRKPEILKHDAETWARLQTMLLEEAVHKPQAFVDVDDPKLGLREAGIEGSREAIDVETMTRLLDADGPMDESPFRGWAPYQARMVQLRLMPQAVSAMMGVELNSESGIRIPGTDTYMSWDPETWLTRGYGIGPMLSGYSLFGRGLRRTTNTAASNFWRKVENINPDHARYLEQKWNGVTKNAFVRAFREREGLTGELADIHKTKFQNEIKIPRKLQQLAHEINDQFTRDEQRAIAELITRQGDMEVSGFRQEVYDTAEEVQGIFRGIREELISVGFPREELELLGDRYMHRVFKNTAKQWWHQDGPTRAQKRLWDSLDAKFMRKQGLTTTLRFGDRAHQTLWESKPDLRVGDTVSDFGTGDNRRWIANANEQKIREFEDNGMEAVHQWRVEKVDTQNNRVVLRRDYTKFERDMFGEVREIAPRINEYAKMIGKTLATGQAFKRIAENDMLSVDIKRLKAAGQTGEDAILQLRQRGWVEVPEEKLAGGVKRYGLLSGKLVDPEAMYVLKSMTSTVPSNPTLARFFRMWRSGITIWKVAKTAYNPGTHGRNFTANVITLAIHGRNPVSILASGAMHIRAKDEMFHRAVEAGMLDSNMLRGELGLDQFMDNLGRAGQGNNLMDATDRALGTYMETVWQGLKRVGRAPMRWYELGDEVFKMGVFAQEVSRGADDAAAIAKAQEWFFDYRDVPLGVRVARDYGIVPFITYTYKVIPLLAKVARDNPHRLIGLIGAAELMSNVLLHQDFGEGYEAVDAHEKELMPDWMGKRPYGVGPRGAMYMGQRESEAGHEYSMWLDYTGQLPGGDAFSAHGIFGGFPFGMNPAVTIMYGLLQNRDPNFDKLIAENPETLSKSQQLDNTRAKVEFILRTLLPNVPLYPGAWSTEKIGNALTAQGVIPPELANQLGWTGKDYWGTDASMFSEAITFLGLARPRRFYHQMETVRRLGKHEGAIKSMENTLKNMANDGRTTEAELERAINAYKEVVGANAEAMEFIGGLYTEAEKVRAQRR